MLGFTTFSIPYESDGRVEVQLLKGVVTRAVNILNHNYTTTARMNFPARQMVHIFDDNNVTTLLA